MEKMEKKLGVCHEALGLDTPKKTEKMEKMEKMEKSLGSVMKLWVLDTPKLWVLDTPKEGKGGEDGRVGKERGAR